MSRFQFYIFKKIGEVDTPIGCGFPLDDLHLLVPAHVVRETLAENSDDARGFWTNRSTEFAQLWLRRAHPRSGRITNLSNNPNVSVKVISEWLKDDDSFDYNENRTKSTEKIGLDFCVLKLGEPHSIPVPRFLSPECQRSTQHVVYGCSEQTVYNTATDFPLQITDCHTDIVKTSAPGRAEDERPTQGFSGAALTVADARRDLVSAMFLASPKLGSDDVGIEEHVRIDHVIKILQAGGLLTALELLPAFLADVRTSQLVGRNRNLLPRIMLGVEPDPQITDALLAQPDRDVGSFRKGIPQNCQKTVESILDAHPHCKLVHIRAPAGAGKSTFMEAAHDTLISQNQLPVVIDPRNYESSDTVFDYPAFTADIETQVSEFITAAREVRISMGEDPEGLVPVVLVDHINELVTEARSVLDCLIRLALRRNLTIIAADRTHTEFNDGNKLGLELQPLNQSVVRDFLTRKNALSAEVEVNLPLEQLEILRIPFYLTEYVSLLQRDKSIGQHDILRTESTLLGKILISRLAESGQTTDIDWARLSEVTYRLIERSGSTLFSFETASFARGDPKAPETITHNQLFSKKYLWNLISKTKRTLRSGEEGDIFTFDHQLFAEFLCAIHLLRISGPELQSAFSAVTFNRSSLHALVQAYELLETQSTNAYGVLESHSPAAFISSVYDWDWASAVEICSRHIKLRKSEDADQVAFIVCAQIGEKLFDQFAHSAYKARASLEKIIEIGGFCFLGFKTRDAYVEAMSECPIISNLEDTIYKDWWEIFAHKISSEQILFRCSSVHPELGWPAANSLRHFLRKENEATAAQLVRCVARELENRAIVRNERGAQTRRWRYVHVLGALFSEIDPNGIALSRLFERFKDRREAMDVRHGALRSILEYASRETCVATRSEIIERTLEGSLEILSKERDGSDIHNSSRIRRVLKPALSAFSLNPLIHSDDASVAWSSVSKGLKSGIEESSEYKQLMKDSL